MPVVGDEVIEALLPGVFEQLVAGLGQWPRRSCAVFVSGVGDDDQLPEGAGAVGVVTEGLLAMVLSAETDEIPLGGGPTQFGSLQVEGDDVVDVAVVSVDGATGMAAGGVP